MYFINANDVDTINDGYFKDAINRFNGLGIKSGAVMGNYVIKRLAVIKAMGSARGIKHLVVLSDGVAIPRNPADFVPIARAAAEAGVQVSVLLEEPDRSLVDNSLLSANTITSAGAGTNKHSSDGSMGTVRRADDLMFIEGAQRIADLAGGR